MQSSNIFASNDAALEQKFLLNGGQGATDNEPKVLAARLLSKSAIYVVERVKRGIYAMTKLQSCIEEGEIRVAAKTAAAGSPQGLGVWSHRTTHSIELSNWREAARLPDDIPRFDGKFGVSVVFQDHRNQTNSNASNHDEAGIESQVSIGDSFMAFNDSAKPGIPEHIRTPPEDGTQASMLEPDTTLLTPDIIMENLRTQYLETLYISKVRLHST